MHFVVCGALFFFFLSFFNRKYLKINATCWLTPCSVQLQSLENFSHRIWLLSVQTLILCVFFNWKLAFLTFLFFFLLANLISGECWRELLVSLRYLASCWSRCSYPFSVPRTKLYTARVTLWYLVFFSLCAGVFHIPTIVACLYKITVSTVIGTIAALTGLMKVITTYLWSWSDELTLSCCVQGPY